MTFNARSSPGSARPGAVLILMLATLAAVPALAQDADPLEAAREQFMAAEGFDARMAILKTFLADHPDHEAVPEVVQAGADLFIEDRDDRAAGVALAEHQLEVSSSADVKLGIQHVLVGLYSTPAYAYKLETLVGKIYDPATMSFGMHLTVLEAAAAAEAWSLVDQQAKAAMPKANAKTFAADYPDRDFSEEEVRVAGRNREGLLFTYIGWSTANQGNASKANGQFKKAAKNLRPSFLGVPTNELYRYWGQTLLMLGKSDEGFEKLTLADVFGGDEKAGAIARKGFAEYRPRETYDEFAWYVRLANAPKMIDFSAANYEKEVQSFHDLKGSKATLVAFWFPT